MAQRTANGEKYSVLAQIRSQLGTLPAGEARVARAILDQPFAAVAWSAQEIAAQADTSPATAVRACHRLGFDGLPEMRLALARELGWLRLSVDAPAGGPDAAVKSIMDSTSAALATIGEHIDPASFRRAAEAVAGARRLLLVCASPTRVVCLDAMFDLISVGRPVEFIDDSFVQRLAAAKLGPGDVCFAFGVSGANELTLGAARAAKATGATLISMTGFSRSALAELAEITITVAGPDMPIAIHGTACLVAMMLVMRAMTTTVAQLMGDAVDSPLQEVIGTPAFASGVRRPRSAAID